MTTWDDMARFLASRLSQRIARAMPDSQMPGIPVFYDSVKYLTPGHMKAAIEELEYSGMCWVFRLKGLFGYNGPTAFRVVPDFTHYPNVPPKSQASVDLVNVEVLLRDTYYMPTWDLAGNMLHETIHLWQGRNSVPGGEGMAYGVQALFNLRAGHLDDNLFLRHPTAMESLILTTGIGGRSG